MQQHNLSVKINSSLVNRLERLCDIMHKSKENLTAEAIEEYLMLHEWQIEAIQKGIQAAKEGKLKNFSKIKEKLITEY